MTCGKIRYKVCTAAGDPVILCNFYHRKCGAGGEQAVEAEAADAADIRPLMQTFCPSEPHTAR